jgi:hypothetical protein
VINISDPGDSGAAVEVLHGRGNKSETIVRSTEARIATTAKELRDWFAMAIGGKPKSVFVFGHSEWIDLALGIEFDAGAVGFEAKDIAAGKFDRVTIGALEFRDVVKTVACIDPTVASIAKSVDHTVGIARGIKGPEDHLALVAKSISVGIA